MKKLIILLTFLSTGFISCKKDQNSSPSNTQNVAIANTKVVASGSLYFSLKENSGSATIYQESNRTYSLKFEKVNFNAGTSLVIYLSSSKSVSFSSIKICSVKNLDENVAHALPDNIDFTTFKYLIIQTELSEQVVASAELN